MGFQFTEQDALKAAIATAVHSPCAKSKRGAVIWNRDLGVVAQGYNHPPHPYKCGVDEQCREACSKINIHAEQAALQDFYIFNCGKDLSKFDMLHVEVEGSKPIPSGPPSCWQCSRHILESGLSGMWLLTALGLQRYTAREFHETTLQNLGLPTTQRDNSELNLSEDFKEPPPMTSKIQQTIDNIVEYAIQSARVRAFRSYCDNDGQVIKVLPDAADDCCSRFDELLEAEADSLLEQMSFGDLPPALANLRGRPKGIVPALLK